MIWLQSDVPHSSHTCRPGIKNGSSVSEVKLEPDTLAWQNTEQALHLPGRGCFLLLLQLLPPLLPLLTPSWRKAFTPVAQCLPSELLNVARRFTCTLVQCVQSVGNHHQCFAHWITICPTFVSRECKPSFPCILLGFFFKVNAIYYKVSINISCFFFPMCKYYVSYYYIATRHKEMPGLILV